MNRVAPAVGALRGICPPGWGGDAGPVRAQIVA
jgi:hypothetical protein